MVLATHGGDLPGLGIREALVEVWPWQDVGEWVTMLSAYRSPGDEHDGFLRIKPACSLP